MVIKIIDGCICDVFEMNDISIDKVDPDKIKMALDVVLEDLRKQAYKEPELFLREILEGYIDPKYSVWDDEPCDQCGDIIVETVWEL